MERVYIVHKRDSVVGSLILSELLRLFGIYVQEKYDAQENIQELIKENIIIELQSGEMETAQNYLLEICPNYARIADVKDSLWEDWFDRNWSPIGNMFLKCAIFESQEEEKLIQRMSVDVIEKRTFRVCYDMRFLYGQDQPMKERMKKILQDTLESTNSIYDEYLKQPDHQTSKYGSYFLINLKRKINRICHMTNYILPYDNEMLMNEADELLKRFPTFKQLYTLKGLIADGDRIMSGYSDIYYKGVINSSNESMIWNDYIAYRLGRFYEKVRANDEMAAKYYELAYRNKDNYRALYKVAFFAERFGNYEQSYDLYKQLTEQLEYILDYGMIQPIQLEYLFKVYYRMIRICRIRFKQYYKGMELVDRAIKLVNEKKFIPFFELFYEDYAKEKEEYMINHLKLDAVMREKEELEMEIRYFEGMIQE